MRRTKAQAEETRCAILDAAERVFYAKGVSTATLEDVARAAGVTRGAIYWHFTNKIDLFLALYNSVSLPQEDMIRQMVAKADTDILASIELHAGDWLEELAGDEKRQRILSILLRCDYEADMRPVLERQNDVTRQHIALLEAALCDARDSGLMDPGWTPSTAARTLSWTMQGMASEWLLFGRTFDLPRDGRDGLKRLFSSFRRRDGAASIEAGIIDPQP